MTDRNAPQRWPLRRVLVLSLAIVLALELLYVAAGNVFLKTSLATDLINRKPEKLSMNWSGATTWLPGLVTLRQVDVSGENSLLRWRAHLDRVVVRARLLPLPLKTFRSDLVRGSGLEFALVRKATQRQGPAQPAALRFAAAKPAPTAPSRPRPARSRQGKRRWKIDLRGVHIEAVRSISIDGLGLSGDGVLDGAFAYVIGSTLRFERLQLGYDSARLDQQGHILADPLRIEIEMSSGDIEPGTQTTAEILGELSGTCAVAGEAASIDVINQLWKQPSKLSIAGSGRLDTRLELDSGALEPGSRMLLYADDLQVRLLDWRARGSGTVRAAVEKGERGAFVGADFDGFTIARGEQDVGYVEGNGLRVRLSGRELDLERGLQDLDLHVELPESRLDIAAYDHYLPGGPLRLRRGQGTLRTVLDYSAADRRTWGKVDVDVSEAAGSLGELDFVTSLTLRTRIRGADLDRGRFDISGSTIEVSGLDLRNGAGKVESDSWWGRLEGKEMQVEIGEPMIVEADIRTTMRDAKPFLAAVAARRNALFWLDELIQVQDVEGRARLSTGPLGFSAHELLFTGDRLEIAGDLGYRDGRRDGLLFLRYGALSAALEIDRGERDWKLMSSRQWFDRKLAERRSAAAAP